MTVPKPTQQLAVDGATISVMVGRLEDEVLDLKVIQQYFQQLDPDVQAVFALNKSGTRTYVWFLGDNGGSKFTAFCQQYGYPKYNFGSSGLYASNLLESDGMPLKLPEGL